MKSRLALIAVAHIYEGPWARVDGEVDHATFDVRGLGEGDRVSVVLARNGSSQLIELRAGSNPVRLKGWERYRVDKIANGSVASPTTVEVFFGCQSLQPT